MAVVRTLIGNVKGPQGKQGIQGPQGIQGEQGIQGPTGAIGPTGAQGPTGPQGATGATGARGSRWNSGTKITGTSTTATIFSGTGITDALVNDMYLNTNTGNTYRCTVGGAASVAKWVYAGNIKGAKGETGAQGIQGETGPQGPQGEKGEKGDTPTLIPTYADILANTVSGYAPDALAVKEGFSEVNNNLERKVLYNKNKIVIEKSGNVIHLFTNGLTTKASIDEFTFPSGFTPKTTIYSTGFYNVGSGAYTPCIIAVSTAGAITPISSSGSNITDYTYLVFDTTYII